MVETKSNAFLVKTDSKDGSKSSISEKWIDNKAIDFKNTKLLSKLYKTYFLRQNDYYTYVGSSQKLDPLFEELAYIPEYRELSEARRIIADETGMDAVLLLIK